MAALRQLPHLFGRRVAVLGAFAVAAFAGVLLSIWQTWQPELALETPTAGPTKDAVARSEMPTNQAKAREAQTGKRVNDDLTHDFGVVPPRSVVTWSYPIENTSAFAWTIDKVHVLCRCTVPGVSARVIAPGKRESVKLQLNCGDEVADIVKAATVRFKEAEAAPVRLLIKACVRAPLTPSAHDVALGAVSAEPETRRALWLMNFTRAPWNRVRVTSCPSWLSALVAKQADLMTLRDHDLSDERKPLEQWHTTLSVNIHELAFGYHQGTVAFTSSNGDSCNVRVWLYRSHSVRIVPSSITFGPAPLGTTVSKTVRLIFAGACPHLESSSVTADIDGIRVNVSRSGDHVLSIQASTTIRSHDSARGFLRIRLANSASPDFSIPIHVHASGLCRGRDRLTKVN